MPPTETAVRACLDGAALSPDSLIGVEPVRARTITAEKVAINAVMAGCLPMHFPVVVTALAAMLREHLAVAGFTRTDVCRRLQEAGLASVAANGPKWARAGWSGTAATASIEPCPARPRALAPCCGRRPDRRLRCGDPAVVRWKEAARSPFPSGRAWAVSESAGLRYRRRHRNSTLAWHATAVCYRRDRIPRPVALGGNAALLRLAPPPPRRIHPTRPRTRLPRSVRHLRLCPFD